MIRPASPPSVSALCASTRRGFTRGRLAGLAIAFLGVFASLSPASPARAQTYPAQPIMMIVPFAAGGSSDVIARLVAEEMGKVLGQRFVIENVGGAGGVTALARTARAAPDGYTVLIGNSGTHAASYSIHSDLRYAPEDFAPVGLVAKTSPMIAVRKDFPAATFAEFLAYVRANPGKVTLAHAGTGSSNYLICQRFIVASSGSVALVGYRGAAPALSDLMGGQVDGACDTATSLGSAVKEGRVRALVVATPERLRGFPDVPTATEAGLPAFEAQGWNALFVPKGTPQPVIETLTGALKTALGSEALRRRFEDLASVVATPDEATPAYVAELVPREIESYRKLLKRN